MAIKATKTTHDTSLVVGYMTNEWKNQPLSPVFLLPHTFPYAISQGDSAGRKPIG